MHLQIGLTAFNMLCWILPLKSRSFSENKGLLSYANAFAGGIFLMLSFGHLLPESIAAMSNDAADGVTKALVYSLVGYMAMLFIEKVVFAVHEESNESQNTNFNGQHSVETSNKQKAAIALCCAMSVHSFFEAAALGLATDLTSAYMMSACIALHQPAESVALLVAFLKAEMPTRRTVLWLTGFSLVSVAGVLAGLMVNRLANSKVEAIVIAITAGTFIYVGATEVRAMSFSWSVDYVFLFLFELSHDSQEHQKRCTFVVVLTPCNNTSPLHLLADRQRGIRRVGEQDGASAALSVLRRRHARHAQNSFILK